jgi:aminopeptidase
MNTLNSAAQKALTSYLNIAPEETALLIYDESTATIAEAFSNAASLLAIKLTLVKIPPTGGHGIEPSVEISEMMKQYDVVIAPTQYSLTHTDSVRNANRAGARVATLPGINPAIFAEGLASDPQGLNKTGMFWIENLQGKHKIRIVTEKGTDVTFTTGNHAPMNDDGILDKPGLCGNLPAGEAFIAPDENSAEGTVVFDGTIGGQDGADLTSPVYLTIKNGSIVDFGEDKATDEGKLRAEKLKKTLAPFGNDALMLAEFGIGTNPNLTMSGNLLGDEKLIGTIHLAFGNNCSMGGSNNVKVHIDCLVTNPKIYIDGRLVKVA